MRYEEPKSARFSIERDDGVEVIRIPAAKNWLALLFLIFWLTIWTLGGGVAAWQAVRTFEPFLFVWLVFWAAGWIFAASTIAWQLTGSETLRVANGDLIYGYRLAGISRERAYRGNLIRALSASAGAPFWMTFRFAYPPFLPQQWGAIKFRYGGRSVQLLQGLDEAEGEALVDALGKKMPASAVT